MMNSAYSYRFVLKVDIVEFVFGELIKSAKFIPP